jgi:hypothetical protein
MACQFSCCGLFWRVDHRHQQCFRAPKSQILFDHNGIAHWHPRNGIVSRIGCNCLELLLNTLQIVGCVLAIDQQPIKARHGTHLGAVTAGHAHPQTNLRVLSVMAFLKRLTGVFMGLLSVEFKLQTT